MKLAYVLVMHKFVNETFLTSLDHSVCYKLQKPYFVIFSIHQLLYLHMEYSVITLVYIAFVFCKEDLFIDLSNTNH